MTDKCEKQPEPLQPQSGENGGGEEASAPHGESGPTDDDEFQEGMLGEDDFPDDEPSPDPDMSASYEIGYGRPPREHQFQPGRSGNPAGRQLPAGPVGLSEALLRSAYKIERVQKGGRTVKMNRLAIMADHLMTKALLGSIKDIDTVIKIMQRLGVHQVEQELRRISEDEETRQNERGWTPEMERRFRKIEAEFFENIDPGPEARDREVDEERRRRQRRG